MATPSEVIIAAHEATGWPLVPLWTIATRVERVGRPEADLLSVYRDHGVVRKADRDDNFNRASEDLSAYKFVRRGDLVLNKMKTWQGSLAVSDYEGIVSPAYFTCTLRKAVHPRYVHYLLRSSAYVAQYQAASKGIRPNQWDLPYDEFRSLPFLLPPIDEQRRIADFLDDQVARIDNIIVARVRQSLVIREEIQEERASSIEADAATHGWIPLRRWITAVDQGWSPQCDNTPARQGEPAVLKLSAVRDGRFDPAENKAMLPGSEPDPRYHVRAGDLLISRANTPELVGDSAVVSEEYDELYLPDLLYRVALSVNESAYVCGALRTPRVRSLLRVIGRGTSLSMAKIRGEDVRALPVPAAPDTVRVRRAREFGVAEACAAHGAALLAQSIEKLEHLKQSLITAAVTGEFDTGTAVGPRVSA